MRIIILSIISLFIFSCETKNKNSQKVDREKYTNLGKEIVKQTGGELLKNVSGAMKKGGPVYAIEFCNLKALTLKDSLSRVHNAKIKRISTKFRNPADMPQTENEFKNLKRLKTAYEKDGTLKPIVDQSEKSVEYYHPIIISKEACLKCHGGLQTEIAEKTALELKKRYPQDKAVDYQLNDFRGAWKLTFKE
jgi:CRISPR/Cas system-associated exonuclease Cas4 (RecB family)